MNDDLERKIELINKSASFSDVPSFALPKVHKEDYYFVSYSHKDYKKVLPDLLLLEEEGINLWYDVDMHIGENWAEIAQAYISKFQCKGIIFYLSENSIMSNACNEEVRYVLKRNKPFFSINIPMNGKTLKSGYDMLIDIDKKEVVDKEKLELFRQAFNKDVLYLDFNEDPTKKAESIKKMKGQDLFEFEYDPYFIKLKLCRDSAITSVDLSRAYTYFNPLTIVYLEEIENYVKKIGSCTFANFSFLEKVTFAQDTKVGECAFLNCTSLKEINIENVKEVESRGFENCSSLEIKRTGGFYGISKIGSRAFKNCDSIKEILIDTVFPLGEESFAECSSLKKVIMDESNTFSIQSRAFRDCPQLETVEFPCTRMTATDATIGEEIFKGCSKLKRFDLKGTYIVDNAKGLFLNCTSLTKVSFSLKTLNKIPESMFENCSSLDSVKLGKAKIISQHAFKECSSLQKIDLKNIQIIEKGAFFNCCNLQEIIFGKKLNEIDPKAFYSCKKINKVTILGKEMGKNIIEVIPSLIETIVCYYSITAIEIMKAIRGRINNIYIKENDVTDELLNEFEKRNYILSKSDLKGYLFYKYVIDENNPFNEYLNDDCEIGFQLKKEIKHIFKDGEKVTFLKRDYYSGKVIEIGHDKIKGDYYVILENKPNEKFYSKDIYELEKYRDEEEEYEEEEEYQ